NDSQNWVRRRRPGVMLLAHARRLAPPSPYMGPQFQFWGCHAFRGVKPYGTPVNRKRVAVWPLYWPGQRIVAGQIRHRWWNTSPASTPVSALTEQAHTMRAVSFSLRKGGLGEPRSQ